jgi:hypothetical protein
MGELIRNVRVQEALDAWATTKDNRTFSDVVRRAIAGDLLLDISTSQLADRQKGPQPGDRLAIASQLDNAGKRVLLAYTDNERLGARSPENTLSLGQPGFGVIEQVFREYEGLVIDAGHPGMFIAYTAELRRALGDEPEAAARLARDLEKRERPFDDFLAGLALAPVYIPVETHRDAAGEITSLSVLTARGREGETLSALFTSPAEVWAWAPRGGGASDPAPERGPGRAQRRSCRGDREPRRPRRALAAGAPRAVRRRGGRIERWMPTSRPSSSNARRPIRWCDPPRRAPRSSSG